MPRINQIQVRRDTAANWTSVNPVLAAGEIGLETNTRKTKFGDGTTAWTSLAYATSGGITSSDTAPSSPSVGDQWFNSSTGKTYVYYDGYWVELDSNGTSAQSTGNAIINGAFDFWQRGSSLTTSAGAYLADRWVFNAAGAGSVTLSRQTFTPGEAPFAPEESAFFSRINITSAFTASNYDQRIEDVRTFAGRTVTFSFYAKADSTKTITPRIQQNFGSGGSASVNTDFSPVELTTSWQRFSRTLLVPSVAGKTIGTGTFISAIPFLTGTQTGTFDIWGVQLEAGSVATPFKRNANSIQGELAACQRYYFRTTPNASSAGIVSFGTAINTTTIVSALHLPVQMRIASSTTIESSGLWATDGVTSFNTSASITSGGGQTPTPNVFNLVATSSGLSQYRPYYLYMATTSAFIGISAEL